MDNSNYKKPNLPTSGSTASDSYNAEASEPISDNNKKSNTGLTAEAQKIIATYGRNRNIILGLIITGVVCLTIALIILVIRSTTPGYELLPAEHSLCNLVATSKNGKYVVISDATRDEKGVYSNYVYLSTDSGIHFGEGLRVGSSRYGLTLLSLSPDGEAIFAQSGSYEMYVKSSKSDTFQPITLNSGHSAKGICYQPLSNYAYIYGDSGVLKMNYIKGGYEGEDHSYRIASMAFDSSGSSALAVGINEPIAYDLSGSNDSEVHMPSNPSVTPRRPAMVVSKNTVLLKSTDGLKFTETYIKESTAAVENKYLRHIFYDGETGGWKLVFDIREGDYKSKIEYYSSDLSHLYIPDYSHYGLVAASDLDLAFWDTNLNGISFHKIRFTSDYYTRDTLKFASRIYSVALSDSNLSYAIINNNNQNYLAKRFNQKWSPIPVLIAIHTRNYLTWVYVLFIIASGMWVGVAILLYTNEVAYKKADKTFNKKSEENELVPKTDQPIGLGDTDLLGFSRIEEAIVRMLRNPDTSMPLTIVISGGWGSGKSSMMNRIRDRLKKGENKKIFLTAWFNAWHQQSEQSMLNVFLLNIIGCYEKYFTLPFRLRLIKNRLLDLNYLRQFGFWFALGVIIPFFLLVASRLFFKDFARENGFMTDYFNALNTIVGSGFLDKGTSKLDLAAVLTKLGAGGVLLSGLFFLRKEWMPSGLSSLIELIPLDKFKLKVQEQSPAFRDQFKKEYWDIIKAGDKKKRIVVFIDDVDRIPGDKILELLNAINFISDTASQPDDDGKEPSNIVFILGMYTQEVVKNLGVKLQDINKSDMSPENIGANYIEKMVDMIVAVPFYDNERIKMKELFMRNG